MKNPWELLKAGQSQELIDWKSSSLTSLTLGCKLLLASISFGLRRERHSACKLLLFLCVYTKDIIHSRVLDLLSTSSTSFFGQTFLLSADDFIDRLEGQNTLSQKSSPPFDFNLLWEV